ncbi:hypothetical protein [Photobacterium swingsii]|uniref:hypothetical protein n=1 Tax=Photobacterium swingsii TaxID=680026 RepID=UPI0040690F64
MTINENEIDFIKPVTELEENRRLYMKYAHTNNTIPENENVISSATIEKPVKDKDFNDIRFEQKNE